MGVFGKLFGSKTNDEQGDVTAKGTDFGTALSMHLQDKTDQALDVYLNIVAESPHDRLAPFFAAAIWSGQGKEAEAAAALRDLSQRIAGEGETISRAIAQELVSVLRNEMLPRDITASAGIVESFGDALRGKDFVRESAVCFEIAAALLPDHANVLHKLGDTLHDLHIYDYSEAVLKEALALAPNHWGSLYTYAVLLQDLGRNEEAIACYERAVTLDPNHVKCRNNFGAALLRLNRLDEALAQCTLAAELAPDSPFVKINLGNIYLLMNDLEQARSCFTDAIALKPDLALAYFGLCSVEKASAGDPGRVRELYEKALALDPSIAEVHQALGNPPEADGTL